MSVLFPRIWGLWGKALCLSFSQYCLVLFNLVSAEDDRAKHELSQQRNYFPLIFLCVQWATASRNIDTQLYVLFGFKMYLMTSFFLQSCYLVHAIQTPNSLLTFFLIKSPLRFLDLLINTILYKIVYPQGSNRDYWECAFSPAPWSIRALSPHSSKSGMGSCLEKFYQGLCHLLPIRDPPDSFLL